MQHKDPIMKVAMQTLAYGPPAAGLTNDFVSAAWAVPVAAIVAVIPPAIYLGQRARAYYREHHLEDLPREP